MLPMSMMGIQAPMMPVVGDLGYGLGGGSMIPGYAPAMYGTPQPYGMPMMPPSAPIQPMCVTPPTVTQCVPPPPGEYWFEYVPIEKKYTDYIPETHTEYIPVEKSYTDYVRIRHEFEYVPEACVQSTIEYYPVERQIPFVQYRGVSRTFVEGEVNEDELNPISPMGNNNEPSYVQATAMASTNGMMPGTSPMGNRAPMQPGPQMNMPPMQLNGYNGNGYVQDFYGPGFHGQQAFSSPMSPMTMAQASSPASPMGYGYR